MKLMKLRCSMCRHWTADQYYPGESGRCAAILSELDIEIQAGWEGGFVKSVETHPDFFCAVYEAAERGEG